MSVYSDGANTYEKDEEGNVTKTRADGSKVTIAASDPNMKYIPQVAGGTYANPTAAQVSVDGDNKFYTVGNWTGDEASYKKLLSGELKTSGAGGVNGVYTSQYQTQIADQLKKAEEESKAALQAKVAQGVNTLSSAKSGINQTYANSAKEAYTLNAKSALQVPQQLSAMGINGGMAQKSIRDMNLAYQNAQNEGRTARDTSLAGVDADIANLQATGDISIAENANTYAQKLIEELQRVATAQQSQSNWQADYDASVKKSDANTTDKQYQDKLALASTLASYGDFTGYAELGIDTKQMQTEWNKQTTKAANSSNSTPKTTETQATVALQAYLSGDRSSSVISKIESYYGMPALTVAKTYGYKEPVAKQAATTPTIANTNIPDTTTTSDRTSQLSALYDVSTQAKIYQLRKNGVSEAEIAAALIDEGKNPVLYGIKGA